MAFVSNSFLAVRKKKLGKNNFTVECNVGISDSSDVTKILSAKCEVCEENSEVISGEIIISGKVGVDILYLTMEGEIGNAFSICPFSTKVEHLDITPGQRADICTKVVDVSVDGVNANNVRVMVSLENNVILIENQEINFIKDGDESICTKAEEIKVLSYVGEQIHNFSEDNEVTIKENVKKVLLCENVMCIKDVNPGVNFVSVGGDIYSRLLYLTEADKFEACYVVTSFKEEIELEGVSRESFVEGCGKVKKCEAKVSIETLEKGVKILLTLPSFVKVRAYNENILTVPGDMYSTKCEIDVSLESYENTIILPPDTFESKIEGSITLSDDAPRIDKVLCAAGNSMVISNSYIKDGEITLEGLAYTSVIYLNDEEGSINSALVEIPFIISEKTNCEGDLIIIPEAVLTDVDVSAKKGREIFFDAKVKANIGYGQNEIGAVISGAEMKEEFPEKDYGLEIYFAKAGQDIWDIAKELKVEADIIMAENPEIIFPLSEDQNIVVYYQKGTN